MRLRLKIISLMWWVLPVFGFSAEVNDSLFTNKQAVEEMTKNTAPSLPRQIHLVEKLLDNIKHNSDIEKLQQVNSFYNRTIIFKSDQQVWGRADYWATPLELLAQGRGDCEDYALSKYWILIKSGISPKQLKLLYVRVQMGGEILPHMVLAYYDKDLNDPLILDNLVTSVYPLKKRSDMEVVFSFGLNHHIQTADHRNLRNNFKIWDDFLTKNISQGIHF